MPQSGLCADSRCNGEIRRLYECHCCSQLICLTHLNEHEEKEKFHLLTQQLRTNIDLIQLSIENRLKRIEQETIFVERERKYLQQANLFLDGRSFPIEDIQKILQDFDQLVQSQSSRKKHDFSFSLIYSFSYFKSKRCENRTIHIQLFFSFSICQWSKYENRKVFVSFLRMRMEFDCR